MQEIIMVTILIQMQIQNKDLHERSARWLLCKVILDVIELCKVLGEQHGLKENSFWADQLKSSG